MDVLKAHVDRRKHLGSSLDTLMSLHEELHGVWREIVLVQAAEDSSERIEELEELHETTREISEKIIAERKRVFGSINYISELDISSKVDSMVLANAQKEANPAMPESQPASRAA